MITHAYVVRDSSSDLPGSGLPHLRLPVRGRSAAIPTVTPVRCPTAAAMPLTLRAGLPATIHPRSRQLPTTILHY